MLGHIFENLLEDNKDKGAFYTPKEIVHYMCGESLIEYLATYLGGAVPREAIELFIRQGIGGGISAHTEDILTALRAVKICDPAIGSGAFPMGILLEIFHAVEVLWDVNPDTTRRIWNLTADKWEHAAAKVKADIIQHSIYGVDIEMGAVDIARLRFWLSLVVDEEEPKPLPNLDYKIMVGNSLISKYEGQVIDIDWEVKLGSAITDETKKAKALQEGVAEKLGKLFEKQHQYFNYKGNKAKLQHEIRDLKIDVLIAQLQLTRYKADQDKVAQGSMFGGLSSAAQKKAKASLETTVLINASISQLRTLKSGNKPLEFFDWKLDFPEVMNRQDGEENGFDIVIGNPPYIQLQKLGSYTDELQQRKLKTFARTGDIYCLFYEIGFDILKKGGFLNYITSNSWLRAAYGEPLRTYLLESTNPVSLIDFGNYKVFENATVNINILIAQRADNEHRAKACLITKAIGSLENLSVFVRQYATSHKALKPESGWVILGELETKIKEKIEKVGVRLKEWDIQINYGIKTGFNDAFIIDSVMKDELIKKSPKNAEIIRPIILGRNLKRYKVDWQNSWLINAHNGLRTKQLLPIKIPDDYPEIYSHLSAFKPEILHRADRGIHWTNLRNCAYLEDFEKAKIVWGNLTLNPQFAFVKAGYFINAPAPFIATENLYILAILNSKVTQFYIKHLGVERSGGYLEYKPMYVEQMPIPQLSKTDERPFATIAQSILKKQEKGIDTIAEEQMIDALAFQLYGFSDKEIQIING